MSDEPRPSSVLSQAINARSMSQLQPGASPYFQPQQQPQVNGNMSADNLQPIRRHNLTLGNAEGPNSPHMPGQVLVPQSSPTAGAQQQPGGFMPGPFTGPVAANSFYVPPARIPSPQQNASWTQPANANMPVPMPSTSSNLLDSILASTAPVSNSLNGHQSPDPLKRSLPTQDIDLAALSSQSSNGASYINDRMNNVHIISQPSSRPPSAQAITQASPRHPVSTLPETDAESSSPVVGGAPRRTTGPRRIADDEDSQDIRLLPAVGSEAFEISLMGFSAKFPQMSEDQKRKAFTDAKGDPHRATELLVAASNPLFGSFGQPRQSASPQANVRPLTAAPNQTFVARSQVLPPSNGTSQFSQAQTQSPRPAHPYPYATTVQQQMPPGYQNQMSQQQYAFQQQAQAAALAAQQQQRQNMMQHPGMVPNAQQYAQTRMVPAAGVAVPQKPDLAGIQSQMRMANYPDNIILERINTVKAAYNQQVQQFQAQHQAQAIAYLASQGITPQNHVPQAFRNKVAQLVQMNINNQMRGLPPQGAAQPHLSPPKVHQQPPAPPRPQVSQLVAAHRPQGPPVSIKRKRRNYSDSDSGGNYSGGSSDEYDDRHNEHREQEALQFFNMCSLTDLPDYTACTLETAQTIIDMRPFETPDDIRNKFRKTKGVSNKLFDSLVGVLEAYTEVDRIFDQCSEASRALSGIMRIWAGQTKAQAQNQKTALLANVLRELDESALDQSSQQWASEEIRDAFASYVRKQPETMSPKVKLKGYQMLGFNWLNLLYTKGLSCILADEMGLGKTAQVITFLTHLKETKQPGPHLVIVPSSTLDNWLREFDVFSPGLKVYSYYGTQGVRYDLRHDLKAATDIDVIVTTYNMATGSPDDRKFLRKMEFKTCTYDEGHQLKNSESKKYKDLMEIKVPWRLLLTGTPLQNNLTELISLLSFILPKIFGQADESLRAIFKVPPEAQANMLSRKRIANAKLVMTPFVLRRKKLQVLKELPQKIEKVEYIEMTPFQRELYFDRLESSKKTIMQSVDSLDSAAPSNAASPTPSEDALLSEDEPPKKKGRKKAVVKKLAPVKKVSAIKPEQNTSNVLMDLRKASNHPLLFRRRYDNAKIEQMARDCLKELDFSQKDPFYIQEDMSIMTDYELHRFVQPYSHLRAWGLQDDEWMDSGKVQWLAKHLPKMRDNGDRVLIFSQFTQALELLEAALNTIGIKYLKLTGQTNVAERQGMVDEFYADETITVFLLSTRAGGLGLNLAAANIVIIHDQDFNPHNDKQAEDRAWRMGQTRDVTVIRLIVKDTIEEDMFALANTKLTLDSELSKTEQGDASEAPSGTATPMEGEIMVEGNENLMEKKAKAGLLKALRAKLVNGDTVNASQMIRSTSSSSDKLPVNGAYRQTPADGPAVIKPEDTTSELKADVKHEDMELSVAKKDESTT